jgi:glycosyltransferase involved in cell wall biosynthesis
MRILIITKRPLTSLSDGYALRVWNSCCALAKNNELYLVTIPIGVGANESFDDATISNGAVFQKIITLPGVPAHPPSFRRHFRIDESSFFSKAYPKYYDHVVCSISEICAKFEIDNLIIFSGDLAGFVQPFGKSKSVVYDVCDSKVLTSQRQVGLRRDESPISNIKARIALKRWAATEAKLPHWFSHVTTINGEDTKTVETLSGGCKNVSTVPNGVDPALEGACRRQLSGSRRRGVAFWGNLSFEPNSDAINYFYHEVYRPFLAPAGIEWCVIGRNAPSWLIDAAKIDSGIRIPGFVDDMYKLLDDYPIMVNPMRIGSGMKNKVLEAFALGLAVVSTSLGIESISAAQEGVDYRLADTPEDFAEAINLLLSDQDSRVNMVETARKTVLENYTWKKVGQYWEDILLSIH